MGRICKVEDDDVNSWIVSFHIEEVRRSEKEIVSFYNLLLQRRDRATRSLSGDGPTIVPASNRTIQSLLAALSGLTGIK